MGAPQRADTLLDCSDAAVEGAGFVRSGTHFAESQRVYVVQHMVSDAVSA
jgi:hypothetical protein